jgi:hypothetical protein
MSVYFPRNVAKLAKLASTSPGRYALGCVRVQAPGDGTYRIEATDGRVLGVVRGPSLDVSYPAVEEAPNGVQEALIPAKDWRDAFRLKGKADAIGLAMCRIEEERPIPDGQRTEDGPESTVRVHRPCLFASDKGQLATEAEEGRYPPTDDVMPKLPPLVSFRLDPTILARLLEVVTALADDDSRAVTFLYFGKGRVIGLAAHNGQGQFFDGVIMPLS